MAKRTTVKDWFSGLPEQARSEALDIAESTNTLDYDAESLQEAFDSSFPSLDLTDEGEEYWLDVISDNEDLSDELEERNLC